MKFIRTRYVSVLGILVILASMVGVSQNHISGERIPVQQGDSSVTGQIAQPSSGSSSVAGSSVGGQAADSTVAAVTTTANWHSPTNSTGSIPSATTARPFQTQGTPGTSGGTTAASSTAAAAVPEPNETPAGKIVVGYYGGWAAYKGYTPQKVPVSQLTHLNYAFAKIDPNTSSVVMSDPVQDLKNFTALRSLKQSNRHLKTLISVGGWDASTYFSDVASSGARREAFAQSCLDFILKHGFDGVDIDWEYPVSGGLAGNTNRPQDKQNFTLLLKAIRQKLDAQGKTDGRRYYLTIAGAAGGSYLSKIEPVSVAGVVDHIFVMAYDMHGPWDQYADFNAPLYRPGGSTPQYQTSVSEAVTAYLQKGVPAKKLVLGMPFYGYIYQRVSSQGNGLYSRFSSGKSISYDAVRSSYLNNSAYRSLWHDNAQVPYISGNAVFISYENPRSAAAKASFAKSRGLGGIGAWELSHDTSGALLDSAVRAFR